MCAHVAHTLDDRIRFSRFWYLRFSIDTSRSTTETMNNNPFHPGFLILIAGTENRFPPFPGFIEDRTGHYQTDVPSHTLDCFMYAKDKNETSLKKWTKATQ